MGSIQHFMCRSFLEWMRRRAVCGGGGVWYGVCAGSFICGVGAVSAIPGVPVHCYWFVTPCHQHALLLHF